MHLLILKLRFSSLIYAMWKGKSFQPRIKHNENETKLQHCLDGEEKFHGRYEIIIAILDSSWELRKILSFEVMYLCFRLPLIKHPCSKVNFNMIHVLQLSHHCSKSFREQKKRISHLIKHYREWILQLAGEKLFPITLI